MGAAFGQVTVTNEWIGSSGDVVFENSNTNVTTSIALNRITGGGFTPSSGVGGVAAFCVELRQTLDSGDHSFVFTADTNLGSRGSAVASDPYGMATGATGGIGSVRENRLNRLFDQFYRLAYNDTWWTETLVFTGMVGSGSTPRNVSIPAARVYAFQLAVWELSHDSNGTLDSGTFEVNLGDNGNWLPAGTTISGSGGNNGRVAQAIRSLAQSWISDAVANPIPRNVAHVFLNDQFAPSPANGTLQDLVIPEPSTTAAVVGALAVAAAGVSRWWSRRRR